MNTRTSPHRPLLPLVLLSGCLLFLGVNGVIGGVLMLRDPNGSPMGMPVSYLARTPFQNWFVPGLWLILIWGSGSILALLGLWMHPAWSPLDRLTRWTHESWAWVLSVMLGMALLVWLTVQVFTLPEMAAIQYILYVLAALLVAVPLVPAMRRFYHL